MFSWGKKTENTSSTSIKSGSESGESDLPKITKPFEHPVETPKETNNGLEDISPSDDKTKFRKYEIVLNHFRDLDKKYPIKENNCPEEDYEALTDFEKSWLTKECILRYLRACNWDENQAIQRITNSIAWRREFGIAGGKFQTLTPEMVSVENETGKQQIFGYDNGRRPCLFLMSGRQNTKTSMRQIQHLIFMLETTLDIMPQNQDKLALCVDFKSYHDVPGVLKSSSMPSVTVGKQVLHILQYHYPERLGRALFINIPFLAWAFLKICYPFVDPYTKQKIAFDTPFTEFIPSEQLALNYGGDINFQYVHEEYWPSLIELSSKRRDNYFKNFEKLGSEIGLSEIDLRELD
ncbi:unnamed protein product [[Candida] boidinii]|uniref:Unnamed protein product n=1 Tax=Candida boidinii TaxID=5477 RepID=A0A9W6WJ36_CANBO|nr:hypothetical protein B5S30_g1208 [[Candida] boidinii]OWB86020.1 hypothetical protein B5S33_g4699 [[Candida] boidinii]GME73205.1 unnamed protein product [[Candida] boidinii]GME98251.1 unnamed protein product [[Candida] boidinii]